MKITISNCTTHSKSPVLVLNESSGSGRYETRYTLKVALNSQGEIYRMLKYSEQPEPCEPFEIYISERTLQLIDNWRQYRNYLSGYKLQKLARIQEYRISLQYSSVMESPLYNLDMAEYYAADMALSLNKQLHEYRKERLAQFETISGLTKQVSILQAKIKVPAIMAAKGCTDKQALAYAIGGNKYTGMLTELFCKKILHPNNYSGSGKWAKKGTDHCSRLASILSDAHIKHTIGNDAPKGGFSGNFIKLT